jgi:hypothetical protein
MGEQKPKESARLERDYEFERSAFLAAFFAKCEGHKEDETDSSVPALAHCSACGTEHPGRKHFARTATPKLRRFGKARHFPICTVVYCSDCGSVSRYIATPEK